MIISKTLFVARNQTQPLVHDYCCCLPCQNLLLNKPVPRDVPVCTILISSPLPNFVSLFVSLIMFPSFMLQLSDMVNLCHHTFSSQLILLRLYILGIIVFLSTIRVNIVREGHLQESYHCCPRYCCFHQSYICFTPLVLDFERVQSLWRLHFKYLSIRKYSETFSAISVGRGQRQRTVIIMI